MVGTSVAVSVIAAIIYSISDPGIDPQDLVLKLQGVEVLLPTIAFSQLALLGIILACWKWTKRPFRSSLGLVAPRVTVVQSAVLVVAGIVPFGLSLLAAALVPTSETGEGLISLWTDTPFYLAVLWVIVIGVFPGCMEEAFFRGILQPAFCKRWKPWLSILVTSSLFGLLHIAPPAIVMATVLGLWLGLVAWRIGSIIPGILTHLLVNSGWNTSQMFFRRVAIDETTLTWLTGAFGAFCLVAFVWGIVILVRVPPEPAGSPLVDAPQA
jgi:membrane protease YdiL (CAAX protease family)